MHAGRQDASKEDPSYGGGLNSSPHLFSLIQVHEEGEEEQADVEDPIQEFEDCVSGFSCGSTEGPCRDVAGGGLKQFSLLPASQDSQRDAGWQDF